MCSTLANIQYREFVNLATVKVFVCFEMNENYLVLGRKNNTCVYMII